MAEEEIIDVGEAALTKIGLTGDRETAKYEKSFSLLLSIFPFHGMTGNMNFFC